MGVELTIQDPGLQSRKLIDAIADAAAGADRGGGIFAFATKKGVDLLLAEKAITPLLEDGRFQLVVGVDAITNERALEALVEWVDRRAGLTARAFVHQLPQIFHPKLCWFGQGDTVKLVLGSGNLTEWGLNANFEAFVVASLEGAPAAAVESEIATWLDQRQAELLAPDAPAAVVRAKKNSGSERSYRNGMDPAGESLDESPPPQGDAEVLVFQLAKKNAGRTLLDLQKESFEAYFHGEAGKKKYLTIQHVEADGGLADPEPPRPVYRVPSGNYRLESNQKRDLASPEQGRAIGVFVRMPNGVFRYRLLWPEEDGHPAVDAFLAENHRPLRRADSLKQAMGSLEELAAAWPDSPFLKMPDGSS